MKLTLRIGAFALVLQSLICPLSSAQDGPPGMVMIKGDKFKIGADTKEIIALVEETQFQALVSETPEHSVRLDDFYIMPTEVTNEQFLKYVEATASKPPQSWAADAIGKAGYDYALKTGKAKKDAQDAGLPIPTTDPFSDTDWWKKNWKEAEWAMPVDLAAHPVIYIDFEQAQSYSRWAGLRLISEQEFQAAGRGKLDRKYSTSDALGPKTINSSEAELGSTAEVGQFTGGNSWVDKAGRIVAERTERNSADLSPICDLSGNVWEWTRSPFVAHPGYKTLKIALKSSKNKKVKIATAWDANSRTAVGGGYSSPHITARLTCRRAIGRSVVKAGLGMRCTASAIPGFDIAQTILSMDLPVSRRPTDVMYIGEKITATDVWKFSKGTATVPNYAMIESYEVMAFIPSEKIKINTPNVLKDRSFKAPIEIGAFSTTIPILEPALDPGTYTLSWRAAGEFNVVTPEEPEEADAKNSIALSQDEDETIPFVEPEFPFDPLVNTLIIRDTNGEIVGWTRVDVPGDERLKAGRVSLYELKPEEAATTGKKAGTVVTFNVMTPSKKPNKGFSFSIPMTVSPGAVDDTWRR